MKPSVIFPELKDQRYDCERCGKGCRELVVHLTDRDRKKIDHQKWTGKLDHAPYIRWGRSFVLNHTSGGECVFLRADGLCAIHAEFGFTEKPLACQLYPFTLEPDGDGLRVSVRFDCPAIAKSAGSTLGRHRQDVVRIAGALKAAAPETLAAPTRPVELTSGRALSNEELGSLDNHLDRWLRDTNRPVMARLVGLADLIETLEASRLDDVRDERLDELIGMLTADLPNVVESLDPESMPPPSRRQLKLFRQAVFAHCENVGLHEARAPLLKRWSYRIDQLKRARQLAGGRGTLPRLVPQGSAGKRQNAKTSRRQDINSAKLFSRDPQGSAPATFEQLDQVQPHPEIPTRDCDGLLTRYLRARLIGRTAFGHGYYDWSVLDGLRALLLALAVTGWVTRYVAVGEGRTAFTVDDLAGALGIVDRNATRSPELGTQPARLRLQYLTQDQGLVRLLRRYPVA
jgi:lysine-N-methylase